MVRCSDVRNAFYNGCLDNRLREIHVKRRNPKIDWKFVFLSPVLNRRSDFRTDHRRDDGMILFLFVIVDINGCFNRHKILQKFLLNIIKNRVIVNPI